MVTTATLLAASVAGAASLPSDAASGPGNITARAAVVLDARTGEILWERDAHRQLPPASTTKILTTVLALESGRLDRSFVVSPLAAAQEPSKLGLRAGQRVRLEDLTYALMLKSANDASVVVAEGLAGSVPAFAELMNERARELGARDSHFTNPHGLPHSEHVSTPYDIAVILRHALTVPGFREVAGTRSKVIHVVGDKVRQMPVYSKNRLLSGYFVPVLGKTGYTRAAGRCFAGAAELNGHRIITVVFGAPDMWGDTRRLMAYGFSRFDDTAPIVQVALEKERSAQHAVAKASKRKAKTSAASSKSRKGGKSKTKVVARKSTKPSASKASRTASVQSKKSRTTSAQSKKRALTQTVRTAKPARSSSVQHVRLSSKPSSSMRDTAPRRR